MHHLEPPRLGAARSFRQQAWVKAGLLAVWLLLFAAVVGPASVLGWLGGSFGRLLLTALAIGALFILPGLAILRFLWVDASLRPAERLALAVGLSIALPPLLLGAAYVVGLPWSRWTTCAYALAALLAVAWPAQGQSWRGRLRPRPWSLSWHALILGGLLLVGLLIRLYIVRDLPVALWADSYHHTMITQLMLENNGLFSSWEPYVPLKTLTYHYGFHANNAFFAWLTGISAAQSVIIVGQLANAATMLMAYLLTTRLGGSRAAGLWAVALTGFFNTMPAYYVNWGRYTQLMGQVLLPVTLVCWMAALEHPRISRRLIALATVASTGLMLIHYLVGLFAAVFMILYIIVLLARRPTWASLRQIVAVSAAVGLIAGLLLLPWGLNLLSGQIDNNAVSARQGPSSYAASVSNLGPISPFYVKAPIVLLAFGGLGLALAQRRWRIALCGLWTLGLFLLIVPEVVGIPIGGVITNFAAYIALYLTLIPLAAFVLGALPQLARRWARPLTVAGAAALIALSLWGARWQAGIIDLPAQQLLTPADATAMEWIRTQTPPDARFLVNTYASYSDSVFIGDDGGWWIPFLTGRHNTAPPMLYMNEQSSIPNYARQVNDFARELRANPLPSPEAIQLCRAAGIDYIYIGPHVGTSPGNQRIDVQTLRYLPEQFPIVYERDGVIIFALLPAR